jgi:hypothetical protein
VTTAHLPDALQYINSMLQVRDTIQKLTGVPDRAQHGSPLLGTNPSYPKQIYVLQSGIASRELRILLHMF